MIQMEPLRQQTILVVDDTPDNVLLLVELLKGVFRVQVATHGAKALELARSEAPPDLILLDVMMPGMDGFEVCRALKADPLTREIPVLFVTSKGETRDEARGFMAGAADYITKPFSAPLVLARVRTHLQQRRLLAAERDLLEQTLKGSLAVILEMISLANPEAPAWDQRLSELVEQTARAAGMAEPWIVGLAAVLSRIGALTVPDAILEKVKAKRILNTEERQAYNRVPEIGYRLLKGIPRLEEVAEMIYYSQKNYDGRGFPPDDRAGDAIPAGARILRVCLDFMHTTSGQEDMGKRVLEMLGNHYAYDPDVVFALKKTIDAGFFSQPEPGGSPTCEVALEDLVEGQVLQEAIRTTDGQPLLGEGTQLGTGHLELLANYAMVGAVNGPFLVRRA